MNDTVRRAFLWACALDVVVARPGNVSIASAGHGMQAAQFLASAEAAAPALVTPGARVGERIESAVRATRAAVGCNTNLGIVLLCAPLAATAPEVGENSPAGWRAALERVLSTLDVDDARAAYRAIAHASPGGLGEAPEQDVAEVPTVDLRTAMRLAADRDTIARQYANGFGDVFRTGLPPFRHITDIGTTVLACWFGWLAGFPDSHIARKHGDAVAQSVTNQARVWHTQLSSGAPPDLAALGRWDAELKAQGINPGTSADLTIASAMLAACIDPALPGRFAPHALGMERVR